MADAGSRPMDGAAAPMPGRLVELLWRAAAADARLLRDCPQREQRGFALVGALVLLQAVLAGTGAFEALLLADGGWHGMVHGAVFSVGAILLAFFWLAVIRLSLVNMGRGLTTSGGPWFRPVPLALRLGGYGLLGTALAQADVVLALRAAGLLRADASEGLLSLMRDAASHGVAVTLAESVLVLIFLLPVLLRGAWRALADGDYEHRHLRQLLEAVVREAHPSARAWSLHMAAHVGGPAPMPAALRRDVFLLEAP